MEMTRNAMDAVIVGSVPQLLLPVGHTAFSWGEEDKLRKRIAELEDQVEELQDAVLQENFFLGAILRKYNVSIEDAQHALAEAVSNRHEEEEDIAAAEILVDMHH